MDVLKSCSLLGNGRTIVPLLSLVILTLGSALLTTFLSIKLHIIGVNNILIGGLSTAYYGGMVLGAFRLERLILRVGHIRAYAAFASILASITILHGLYVEVYFWLLLRLAAGIATAGLYIVIESWILSETNNSNRGSSLAIYMVALYVAQSVGQLLLNIGNEKTLFMYCLAAILASLSVIPLTLTKSNAPVFNEPETLGIKGMFSISPSGVITCFAGGLILGGVYGLYPIFIENLHYPISSISIVMGLTILGGMVFQYPLGGLSDVISRRYVIISLCITSILLSLILLIADSMNIYLVSILSFFLGGALFCIYPIGISHACDRVNSSQLVSATQTLLLAYGLGATLGPVLAPLFDLIVKSKGLLVFIALVSFLLGLFIMWRKQIASPEAPQNKQDFTLYTELTPVAAEMDQENAHGEQNE